MEKSIIEAIGEISAKVEAVTMSVPKLEMSEDTLKELQKELDKEFGEFVKGLDCCNLKCINGLEIEIKDFIPYKQIYLVPNKNDEYITYCNIDNKLEW